MFKRLITITIITIAFLAAVPANADHRHAGGNHFNNHHNGYYNYNGGNHNRWHNPRRNNRNGYYRHNQRRGNNNIAGIIIGLSLIHISEPTRPY